MSEYGTFDGDEVEFTLEDEDLADGPLPVGAAFPLPESLASVLMAWAIARSPDAQLGDEGMACEVLGA